MEYADCWYSPVNSMCKHGADALTLGRPRCTCCVTFASNLLPRAASSGALSGFSLSTPVVSWHITPCVVPTVQSALHVVSDWDACDDSGSSGAGSPGETGGHSSLLSNRSVSAVDPTVAPHACTLRPAPGHASGAHVVVQLVSWQGHSSCWNVHNRHSARLIGQRSYYIRASV